MYKVIKRFFDISLSLTVFLCTAWILIPCMIILKCTGEHEIWYFQKRVGFKKRIFNIFKFATMLKDSPNLSGGTITTRNDSRVLPFGRFLRKTKINELPQIFNVLNGSMSIVGPRPLVEEGFELYPTEIQNEIYNVKPGITGIGSLIFRDEEKYLSEVDDSKAFYRDKIMPYKGELEMWYKVHASCLVDFKIIFLTAWQIIFPASTLAQKWFPNLPTAPSWL